MYVLLFRDRARYDPSGSASSQLLAHVPISETTLNDPTADFIGPVIAYLQVNGKIDASSQVQVTGVEIPEDSWTDVC